MRAPTPRVGSCCRQKVSHFLTSGESYSPAEKPQLPDDLFETLRGRFGEDVPELQKFAGREFADWNDYS